MALFILVIIAYLSAMLAIGILSRRRVGRPEGFFVAHRQGTLAVITGSLLATIIGGSSTIGLAGLGFEQGLVGAWWLLVGAIGLVVLGLFLARRVRSFALYTLPELLERQYDHRVGLAASLLIVVAWVGVVAGQIVAAGKLFSVLGLGSAPLWMLIFALVAVAYTFLGGQYSIIRTDFVQAIILFVGILAALAAALPLVGGISGLSSSLSPDFFSFPLSTKFGLKHLLSFLLLVGATYVVGPDIYTRLFSANDESTARSSALICALFLVVAAFIIVLLGMCARALYPEVSPEQALPQVIRQALPLGLSGVVFGGLVAALMSSADTCLLSQSVILVEDVIKRRHPLGDRETVQVTRASVVLLGGVALALALTLKGVIASLLFAYTVFTCGLVLPTAAGFFRERLGLTSEGALAALIGGGMVGLLGKVPGPAFPLKGDLPLIGFALSAVLLFGVSFFRVTRKG